MINCHKCKKELKLTAESTIGRRDICEYCQTDLRCCFMCHFWDKNSYNECREPGAERIVDKEKANYCDYFKIRIPVATLEEQKRLQLEKAMALFKK